MNNKVFATATAMAIGMMTSGCISLGLRPGVPEMEERVVVDHDADEKVAVVDVVGMMSIDRNRASLPFGGARDNILGRTQEQLGLAAEDPDVRAVIVRISSPGGEVYPSLEIHRQIARFREETKKPVIAYVPDVAASGGFLAAVGADEIIADESAITGSIGVLVMLPDLSGLMNLMRVKVNVFKAGERKDIGNPFREMTGADRAEIEKLTVYFHERFKALVDAGRHNLNAAEVEAIADGRVFTATEARDKGLVDAVGDLAGAHARAAERAGFTRETTNLVLYRRPNAYGNSVYAMTPNQIGGIQINLDADTLMPRHRILYMWQPGI